MLRVIGGDPTDEELAAVVAALSAARRTPGPVEPPRSGWSAYWRSRQTEPPRGPDAWRLSGR